MNRNVRQGRRTLLLLAAVFLGPMAVAMLLYFTGFQWRPQGTAAHGQLFDPARPLPDLGAAQVGDSPGDARLRGKWTLLYIAAGPCAEPCRQALVAMRQVRRALGRDLDRVQRVYLADAGTVDAAFLEAEHPGLVLLENEAKTAEVAALAGEVRQGDIFLADPLGNLVMRYPAGTDMKGMHSDLQRLLKISTIG